MAHSSALRPVFAFLLRSVLPALLSSAALAGSIEYTASPGAGNQSFATRYPTYYATNGCSSCHTSAPSVNASYGTSYRAAILALGRTQANVGTALANIEGVDSDSDGYTNISEINANKKAYDSTEHPTAAAALSSSETAKSGAAGSTVSYSVTVTNNGNLTDSFTLGVSVTSGQAWTASIVGTANNVIAGGTAVITVNVAISGGAAAGQSSVATVTAASQANPAITATPLQLTTGFLVTGPRYVNASMGVNTGNCTNSSSPCKTITYAMAQAASGSPGDVVNVSPGTYDVALGEVFPITVKSGVQLKSTTHANATIIDALGANKLVLQTAASANSSTLIQGFTIRNGLNEPAADGSNANGGGIAINGGSPVIQKNVIIANEARGYAGTGSSFVSGGQAFGGGIYGTNATPTIVNNVIRDNIARGGTGKSQPGSSSAGSGGGSGHGGGINISGPGGGSINNNTFYNNQAIGGNGGFSSGGSGGAGGNGTYGAIFSSGLSVNNNLLAQNKVVSGSGGSGAPTGAAGFASYGAMQYNSPPAGDASNNLFHGNTVNGAASTGDTIGTNSRCFLGGGCASVGFHAEPSDLQITSLSPAAGTGTATGAPADDFLGTTRANPPSIGAFEARDPTVTFNVVLEGWQQVAPYVVTAASGAGTATYNTVTRGLTLNLPYSSLSSTEVAAHIHGPAARGANAGVLHSLSAANPKTDTVTLTAQQETNLYAGQLYVNIHTSNFPSGEIRGQIDNLGATVTRALTVTKMGAGTGTVTGTTEAGTVINCGSDCSESVPNGKVVTLSGAATGGSTFNGWGGACTGTGSCMVTMDAAKTVTASFDPPSNGSSADVALTQAVAPAQASSGKDIVYTLTVVNNGPATAAGVTLTQPVPAGTTFIWTTPNCGQAAGTVTCNLGSLAAGAGVRAKIVVRPPAAGSVTNTATVTASQPDPNSTNNTVSATRTVDASPAGTPVLRYRLYSDISKEHHFTTDLNEYNTLGTFTGVWVKEGTVGKVLNNPGSFNGVAAIPYYRLYDNQTLWHHWTSDPNEYYILSEFPWWSAEGVDGYILPTQASGSIPLFRLLYPFIGGLHHWTIDAYEYGVLTSQYGWVGEGGSGYVIP